MPVDSSFQMYLSREHDKQSGSTSSPGPYTCSRYSSLGKQRPSLHRTAPQWGCMRSMTLVSGCM